MLYKGDKCKLPLSLEEENYCTYIPSIETNYNNSFNIDDENNELLYD